MFTRVRINLRPLTTLCLLLLLAVPVFPQETESTRPRTVQEEKPKPKTAKQLAAEYQEFLQKLLPEHRAISVHISPQAFVPDILFAEHPLFNRYSFRVGPLGDHVWNWLVEHKDELKAADIGWVAVGWGFRDRAELAVKDAFPKKEKKK